MKTGIYFISCLVVFYSCLTPVLKHTGFESKVYQINIPNYCIKDTIRQDVILPNKHSIQFSEFQFDTNILFPIHLPDYEAFKQKSNNILSLEYLLNTKPFDIVLWSYGESNGKKASYVFSCEFVDIYLESKDAWNKVPITFNIDTFCSMPVIVSFRNGLYNVGIGVLEKSSGTVLMDTSISSSRYILAFENILPGDYEIFAGNGFYGSYTKIRFTSDVPFSEEYDKINIKLKVSK